MKSKVLLPVDTARNSKTTEEYAIRLNWRMPLKVTLLNVMNTKRLEQRGISPDDQDRIKNGMRRRAEDVLKEASAAFEKADLDFETRIEEGQPAVVICRVAETEEFDMVLMPQAPHSEIEEILGGSVVHNVLWKCKIPVLLVKHTEQQLEAQRRRKADK